MKKPLLWGLAAVLGLALLLQLVPYGRDHSASAAPAPDLGDAKATALFEGACADCHSNHTSWPWYSNVAPMSWLVQRDVDDGREEWNVSKPGAEWGEGADEVLEGGMPPRQYTLLHSAARLSDSEKQQLADALEKMG